MPAGAKRGEEELQKPRKNRGKQALLKSFQGHPTPLGDDRINRSMRHPDRSGRGQRHTQQRMEVSDAPGFQEAAQSRLGSYCGALPYEVHEPLGTCHIIFCYCNARLAWQSAGLSCEKMALRFFRSFVLLALCIYTFPPVFGSNLFNEHFSTQSSGTNF